MTTDDIIRMAREAGLAIDTNDRMSTSRETHFWVEGCYFDIERFVALLRDRMISEGWRQCAQGQKTSQFCAVAEQARLEEREACAQICDRWCMGPAEDAAFEIRARGHAQVADRLARHGIPFPGDDNGRDPV